MAKKEFNIDRARAYIETKNDQIKELRDEIDGLEKKIQELQVLSDAKNDEIVEYYSVKENVEKERQKAVRAYLDRSFEVEVDRTEKINAFTKDLIKADADKVKKALLDSKVV